MNFSTVTCDVESPCKVGLGTLHSGREAGTCRISLLGQGLSCFLKLQDPGTRLVLGKLNYAGVITSKTRWCSREGVRGVGSLAPTDG